MTGSIRFGEWVWDPNTLELRNGSHVTTLEPRVAKLLEYLVTHPGELLSHDRIVEAVWDGRVVSDEAVRRAVFNLRQALANGGSDNYIRTIHKKGYVATFPAHEATNAESLSAASTGALPGATPRAGAGPTALASNRRWPILLWTACALALVAAILAVFDSPWQRKPEAGRTEISAQAPAPIAVLPFINFNEDADGEFLADGLSEELLGTLARNPALRVTARSSAFQFKGQQRDARDIGRQLGVRYVLEGSVRRFEERVRINIQLIDTETGTQLWSEAYDRTLADWFAVQQDVAVEVARALNFVLQQGDVAGAATGGTTNVEAHLEVLRARQLLASRSVTDAEQAIEHLQRALTLDANYALAYARLADAILIQAESTSGVKGARPVVSPLLDKALALDPGLGEAYALRSMLTDDPAAAERDLRRGLELNPSYARGYELLAGLQAASAEKLDQAVSTIDRAIALDPLTPGNFHIKALLMMALGKWPESVALEQRALELNPKFRAALVQLGAVLAVEGKFAEAIGSLERAVALDPRATSLRSQLLLLYLSIGDSDSAAEIYASLATDNAGAVNSQSAATDQLFLLWSQGEIGRAADMVYSGKFGPLAKVAPDAVSQILLVQALEDRDFNRALAALSTELPVGESLPPEARLWRLYAYANKAQLLALSGDTDAAARLEQLLEERMDALITTIPRHALINDQVRATLLAGAGHSQEACAALERVYTPAPRRLWRVVLAHPAFDTMRTDPCFQGLTARVETYIAAERATIDAMRRAQQIPDRSRAGPARGVDPAS